MKIVLIDDQESVRKNLRALLAKYAADWNVIGEAYSVESGLKLLSELKTDVVFLDVEMADGTGFDLLAQYGSPDFQVVFATGYDRYAVKAFKYSAVDYLLKPIDPADLVAALKKVERQSKSLSATTIDNMMANLKVPLEDQKIVLKDLETVYLVKLSEIVRCESQNNYTTFFLMDGRKLTISVTLKEYDKLLSEHNFFRVHQSHLINLQHFDRYDKREGGVIYMKDGSTAPLAGRRKDHLIATLKAMN